MADQSRSEIIKRIPLGERLNHFRDSWTSLCNGLSRPYSQEALDKLDNKGDDAFCLIKVLCSDVRKALQVPVLQLLQTLISTLHLPRDANLLRDLLGLVPTVAADDYDYDRIKPLLTVVANCERDEII